MQHAVAEMVAAAEDTAESRRQARLTDYVI